MWDVNTNNGEEDCARVNNCRVTWLRALHKISKIVPDVTNKLH